MIDSPSITEAPMDEERVRKSAPTLLMALIWLYGLESREVPDRSDDYEDEKMLAMHAAALAIADATGMQPS